MEYILYIILLYIHPADALYHSNRTLKIMDYIKILNCMFVKNVLPRHFNLLSNFQGTF